MKYLNALVCGTGLMLCAACGGGKVEIDRTGGEESTISGSQSTSGSSEAYFTNDIFPLLIKDRSSSTGGCAASGCHLKGSASSSETSFYQINASSASDSWNWAQVRRNRVISANTTYATSSSSTLAAKKDSNHQSFRDWATSEKLKLDEWVALP